MSDMTGTPRQRFFEGDLTQLRCFYYAALFHSFTRAAEHLFTTQPSVSHHIKALEDVLGTGLFRRHARGVGLTEAGEALLTLVQPLIEGVDQLAERLKDDLAARTATEIRLAAGHELLLHLAGPALRAYRGDHPEVRLIVYSSARRRTQEMVARDEIEFGIASPAGLSRELAFEHVLDDELFLICPLAHPLTVKESVGLEDIARYPVLMPDPASSTRAFVEQAFAAAGLELRVAMELERWHVIKRFVALDQGISLVPGFCVADDAGQLAVRRVRATLPRLTYGIVTRRGRHLSAPVHDLIAAIRSRGAMLAAHPGLTAMHR